MAALKPPGALTQRRKSQKRLSSSLTTRMDEKPGPLEYALLERVLGLSRLDLPDFESNEEMHVFLMHSRALLGHEASMNHLYNRLAPQPQKIDASVEVTAGRPAMPALSDDPRESDLAGTYMDELDDLE